MTLGVATMAPRVAFAESRTECVAGTDTAHLNSLIANELADLVGFDTPRVIALPDGRYVWTVQDAFISSTPGARSSSLRPPTGFAHNALIVQEGNCFTTLHGPITPGAHCSVADASYVGADLTATCSHWFWPISGGLDNSAGWRCSISKWPTSFGTGAAANAHPVAMWVARLDLATLDLISFAPAPASAGDVAYGSAVESDGSFSYLFGWSYDQFNLPDPTSPPPSQMFVARVPLGRFDLQPTYWNGADWVANRAAAVAISTDSSGATNPMQPRLIDGMWISVVKADDWNGTTVRVDTAPAAQGPWTTVQTVTVPTRTVDGRTNTYVGASDAVAIRHREPCRGHLQQRLADGPAGARQPHAVSTPPVRTGRTTGAAVATARGLDRATRLRTDEPADQSHRYSPHRPVGRRARPARRFGRDRARRRQCRRHRSRRRRPGGQWLPDGVVVRRADAADIEPQLRRWCSPGRRTRWSRWRPTTRSACTAWSPTDVLVDVTGSYTVDPSACGFHPLAPTRIYDSRVSGGTWQAGETRAIAAPARRPGGGDQRDDHRAHSDRVRHRVPVPGGAAGGVEHQLRAGPDGRQSRADRRVERHDLRAQPGPQPRRDRPAGNLRHGQADGLHYQAVSPTRLVDTRAGIGSVFGRVAMDAGALGLLPSNGPVSTTVGARTTSRH